MPKKINTYDPDQDTKDQDLKAIGQRLTYFRSEFVGGQKDVFLDGAISTRTLSRIENGLQYPSRKYLTYLGKAHKMNIEWALTGKGPIVSTISEKKDHIESVPARVALLEAELAETKALLRTVLEKLKTLES